MTSWAAAGQVPPGDLDRQLSGTEAVDGLARPWPLRRRDAKTGLFDELLPAGGVVTVGSVHHARRTLLSPRPG